MIDMNFITAIPLTVAAWLVHASLVGIYMRFFSSTHQLPFRIVHATEIFTVFAISVFIGLHFLGMKTSRPILIASTIITLFVIDVLFFVVFKAQQGRFDAWHFIAANIMVIAAVSLAIYLSQGR
ncbi:MAG: hypothetical protein M3Q36_04310 [bacterium]|nr:hypothetical protein [bacterium]